VSHLTISLVNQCSAQSHSEPFDDFVSESLSVQCTEAVICSILISVRYGAEKSIEKASAMREHGISVK
jgi:hypothetical protein